MPEPAEKPSLHSCLCERYGSSTHKLAREHERSLHKRARCNNHHIFNMRCHDEVLIPSSLKIKPPVKTKEWYKIAERAGRAFLSARIRETYRSRCELSSKVLTLQSQLQSELLAEDYQKVTRLSYAAAENTHDKTKLNQTKKLGKLVDRRDARHELRPQGSVALQTTGGHTEAGTELHTSPNQASSSGHISCRGGGSETAE